jgi:diguanylate cyclase (GGDEF)-like protein/PAS domain S-box-containing protein
MTFLLQSPPDPDPQDRSVSAARVRPQVGRYLALNLGLLTLSICALAATALGASYVLSGVRAYVGGEGLWSKGEKDAVLHLTAFALTRDGDEYQRCLAALAVPLGDHRARLELERPVFDRGEALAGLRAGRIHPQDRPAIIWLFRHFRGVGAFDRAVRIWRRGDLYILALRDLAQRVRAESAAAPLSAERRAAVLREIAVLNREVTALEDDFSYTLGDLARRLHVLVVALVLAIATLLLAGTYAVSLRMARQLRRQEEAQRRSEERYRSLVETSQDLIWSVDESGHWTFVNPVVRTLQGYEPEEMVGRPWSDLQPPERAEADRQILGSLLDGREASARFETVHLRRDGRPVHLRFNAVALRDGRGRVVGATGTAADISDQKRAESVIRYQASHDALTGLVNRAIFLERLRQAIAAARRRQGELAVFFLDLDRFKAVNDSLGHAAGDELLKTVAERVRGALREDDLVGRLGGDEFTILVQSWSRIEGVARVAQKLLDRIAEPLTLDGATLQVSASIGVSIFPADGLDADALLRGADLALYRAKQDGRGGYQLCCPAMKHIASRRQQLESELRAALARQEMEVHYQPVTSVADGTISSFEALVRWRHPRQGLLPPSRFLPLAEELRLVVPLGEWVLRTACAQVVRWQAHGWRSLRVAVNVSARQFEDADFPATVEQLVRDAGIDPAYLDLEITESAALQDIGRTVESLGRLRDHGIPHAKDDIGAGQTSLGNLARFPLDVLKIDQGLVSGLRPPSGGDPRPRRDPNEVIVGGLINVAHGLGLRAVAEGVETDSQLAFLAHHGCDEYQGYLCSRPLPAAAVENLLRRAGPLVPSPARRKAG